MSVLRELRRRNVVRVAIGYGATGWIVVQIAAVLLPVFKAPEWVLQAFTTLVVLGFPLALVFAWAFELTPEGLKRTDDVPREESITRQTGRQLDFLIIGALVLAVLVLGLKEVFRREQVQAPAPVRGDTAAPASAAPGSSARLPALLQDGASIAVLPFANRSTSADDAYFADGMHDELLTQLAQIGTIKVIARTSVLRFRDTQLPISEIARQLGVATVLEGSVQRAGGQVRINVQLIDAATDAHLWAQVFDRALSTESVFAIQSEITREIAAALKTELSPRDAARIGAVPSGNLEAYEHYLRGRQLLAERKVDAIRRGHAELEQAVALDPNFAPALVELANALHLLYEYADEPVESSLKPAHALLNRALAIDPQLAAAYALRGEILRHEKNFAASDAAFVRALELAPGDAQTYAWFALLRSNQGRIEDTVRLLTSARKLNPLAPLVLANLGFAYFELARDEEAVATFKHLQTQQANVAVAWTYEAYVHEVHGDLLTALRVFREAERHDPDSFDNGTICDYLADLDADEAAADCAARLLRRWPGNAGALLFSAYLPVARGRLDEARRTVRAADSLADPDTPDWVANNWPLRVARQYVNTGQLAPAHTLFRSARPDWFDGTTLDLGDDLRYPVAAAVTMFDAGEGTQAVRLLQAALARMAQGQRARGNWAYGHQDVAAYALLGDSERALSALAEVADMGYLPGWHLLEVAPQFERIRADSRFAQAIAKLKAKAAQQRELARREGLLEG